jgi:hypothetical protein
MLGWARGVGEVLIGSRAERAAGGAAQEGEQPVSTELGRPASSYGPSTHGTRHHIGTMPRLTTHHPGHAGKL